MTVRKGTALITGASMGLGREFARLFAADGIDVVLVARSEGKLRELAAELEKAHGIRAHVVADDLTDPAAPERIFQSVKRAGVELEYLVNNAGFGSHGRFDQLDAKRELEMVQVNIAALVHLTRLFLPELVSRGHGRVMNIASTAGFQPGPLMATYYATKAFVISFTEAIAYELRHTGVTVTAHCPGATATEFARTASNDTSMLFRLGAADAPAVARHAYRAMQRGQVLAIHGIVNWLLVQSVRFSPRALVRATVAWVNSK
jgi:short-subunit dehydrogenase